MNSTLTGDQAGDWVQDDDSPFGQGHSARTGDVTTIANTDRPAVFVGGYRDRSSIDNRANAALLAIERIINDTTVPSAVRLVRIAERMASEPILTDDSPAAHEVRRESGQRA